MEVPTKVTNVFKSRDVNVCKNNLVTKSPLTFSNKLERSQKSQIGTVYPINSKAKLDSINQISNCFPSGQIASTAKVSTATDKPDSHFSNRTQASSTSLDASLGFPEDDWDDFDDFEIPVKGKNVSCNSEKCETSTDPVPSPSEEKSLCIGKGNNDVSVKAPEKKLSEKAQAFAEVKLLEQSVQGVAEVSPGPGQDEEDSLFGDSPVRPSRRRRTAQNKSVLSDSDDDNHDEPLKEAEGNKLFMTLFISSHNFKEKKNSTSMSCMFLEIKSSWNEPNIIDLDDNSEPENDLDFIPPSPVSDEISSALAMRSVHPINSLLTLLLFNILKDLYS